MTNKHSSVSAIPAGEQASAFVRLLDGALEPLWRLVRGHVGLVVTREEEALYRVGAFVVGIGEVWRVCGQLSSGSPVRAVRGVLVAVTLRDGVEGCVAAPDPRGASEGREETDMARESLIREFSDAFAFTAPFKEGVERYWGTCDGWEDEVRLWGDVLRGRTLQEIIRVRRA